MNNFYILLMRLRTPIVTPDFQVTYGPQMWDSLISLKKNETIRGDDVDYLEASLTEFNRGFPLTSGGLSSGTVVPKQNKTTATTQWLSNFP